MKKIELLSPVGNIEHLYYAIYAGCDAIYLGGTDFNARNYAGNFSRDELKEAINIAHMYGVKAYITLNTLIKENEVEKCIDYIDFLASINVDALIMQDIGMIDYVRKVYPNMEIHASTQMHIHNIEGLKFVKKLGLKRAVIARETSIDTIKQMKEANIELECFIHGALCFSYSGQCLMSSLIGNRSANKGSCVGSCRLKYSIVDKNDRRQNKDDYPLSMKDLSTIEDIKTIIESGVTSLKIEGRMKRKEYIYLVTSVYRKAIDAYYNKEKFDLSNTIKELKKIYNRMFTKGFILNESDNINAFRPNHMGIKIGKVIDNKKGIKIKLDEPLNIGDGIRFLNSDLGFMVTNFKKNGNIVTIPCNKNVKINDVVVKTTDKKQLDELKNLKPLKIPIKMVITLNVGKKIELVLKDGKNNIKVYSENLVCKAKNYPLDDLTIERQMAKLGDSIYKLDGIDIIKDDNIYVDIKELNEIRRKGILKLNEKRCYKIDQVKKDYYITLKDYPRKQLKTALISNESDFKKVKNFDVVYSENIKNTVLKLPVIMDEYKNYDGKLLVSELGSVYKYKNVDIDYTLNVTNSYSVAFFHSILVDKITLSVELNFEEVEKLIDNYHKRYNKHPNLEVVGHGKIQVMVSKNKITDQDMYLKDRFSNLFPIINKGGYTYIYHFLDRNFNDDLYYGIGINSIRYDYEKEI